MSESPHSGGEYVEEFPPFTDLPEYAFDFSKEQYCIRENPDISVWRNNAGHYAVYRLIYKELPESHPDSVSYIVYDMKAIREREKKVYKIFNRNLQEMTLGEATYDLGLLFSEGRVYADTHFLSEMGYLD